MLPSSWLVRLAVALFAGAFAAFIYFMATWDSTAFIVAVVLAPFGALFLVLALPFAVSRRAASRIELRQGPK